MTTTTITSSLITSGRLAGAARVGSYTPAAYRLIQRAGELTLQGCYIWQQGEMGGKDWRDIPTVNEQETGKNA